LGALNARESKLLGLQDALETAVRKMDNRDMLGIGTPIAAGAAGMATAVGIMKAILDNPAVKSRLAANLRQAASKTPKGFGAHEE
jgi:hypothetical protein